MGIALLNAIGCDPLSNMFYDAFKSSNLDSTLGFFKSGFTIIPHPDKVAKGGEDALVVRSDLISVADGVGGWGSYGVDPGKYSKQLVKNIADLHDLNPKMSPKELLIQANKNTKETGTSTCIVIILNSEKQTVATTLLGDSSYMILRPDPEKGLNKIFRSEEQQHSFNFPFQWGTDGDDPSLAIDNEHQIKNNDIIILGSDGVFDNCFDEEIMNIIKSKITPDGNIIDIQDAANSIAKLAQTHGVDRTWRSPFQVNSEKANRFRIFRGGKQDDVSLIVSQIKFD